MHHTNSHHIISFKSVRHFSEERGDTHHVHGSDEYSNLTWVGWVLLGCHTLRRTGVRLVHVACRLVSGFCMFLLLTWLVRDGGMRRQGACPETCMHVLYHSLWFFMHSMNSMPLCLLCLLKSVFRRQQGSSHLLITNQSTFSRSCCVKVAVTCWFRYVKKRWLVAVWSRLNFRTWWSWPGWFTDDFFWGSSHSVVVFVFF